MRMRIIIVAYAGLGGLYMLRLHIEPESCLEQLRGFDPATAAWDSEILNFGGVGDCDVYNPSVPFENDGETLLAGRVESRDSEASEAVFFAERDGVWMPREGLPRFKLQDPFVTRIGGELIFGGVRVAWDGGRIVGWATDFYRGQTVGDLQLFASGPPHMKDIRLVGLRDGRVGIFSRPDGDAVRAHGCLGRAAIGFAVVDSLEDVTPKAIAEAPLLRGHFLPDEWGGCNQLYALEGGLIGVVGHKAYMTLVEGVDYRHYHSMAFAIHPDTRAMTPCRIICTRGCFPEGPSKRPDLVDVVFTAGLIRNGDGTATLYTGLSDCQVGRAVVADPFVECEQSQG